MTFVNIFVNILDGLDRSTYFNIDVAVVPGRKIRIIWHYITVIAGVTTRVGGGPTIIGSSILRITILAQVGFSTEILWIMLAALFFDHARCIWEFRATGTMDHALGSCGIEDRVSDWIWYLSRDNGVDVMCIAYFELLLQKEQEVDVRQTTLLELYSEDKPLDISKHPRLYIVKHGLYLLNKDASHNVREI